MKVYREISEFSKARSPVVTTGTFDGVHLGHQKIIHRMKEIAAEIGGETLIITFFPHPRMILHPEETWLKLLNTIPEKIELLEGMGIDHLLITPFTRDFSNLTSDEFVTRVLVERINCRKLVIGYDHHFGKDRKGSLASLRDLAPVFGFEVEEISKQDIEDIAVSSTKIRNALLAGDIATASAYLRYHYPLTGTVMLGDQLGRTLGYPTANLLISETYKLIPADGIYAVEVKVASGSYRGMLYIGNRPVVNGMNRSIEVNIFDFDDNIYSQRIQLRLKHYIRGDRNFTNLEEMKVQMGLDRERCLELLDSSR